MSKEGIMGEIKNKLEQLAADMPQRILPSDRAKKTNDLYQAMPSILVLLEKGYSLYQITQFLQVEGISVSYSLVKNTVRKKMYEMQRATELADDVATEIPSIPETGLKSNTKALAEIPSPAPSPQSPASNICPLSVGKIFENLGTRLPHELKYRLSTLPASMKFNVTICDKKVELAQFIREVECQLAEIEENK